MSLALETNRSDPEPPGDKEMTNLSGSDYRTSSGARQVSDGVTTNWEKLGAGARKKHCPKIIICMPLDRSPLVMINI